MRRARKISNVADSGAPGDGLSSAYSWQQRAAILGFMNRAFFLVALPCLAIGTAACTGDLNRSMCEGLQTRVRVVDPLAERQTLRDQQVSCEAYAAERERLLRQQQ